MTDGIRESIRKIQEARQQPPVDLAKVAESGGLREAARLVERAQERLQEIQRNS